MAGNDIYRGIFRKSGTIKTRRRRGGPPDVIDTTQMAEPQDFVRGSALLLDSGFRQNDSYRGIFRKGGPPGPYVRLFLPAAARKVIGQLDIRAEPYLHPRRSIRVRIDDIELEVIRRVHVVQDFPGAEPVEKEKPFLYQPQSILGRYYRKTGIIGRKIEQVAPPAVLSCLYPQQIDQSRQNINLAAYFADYGGTIAEQFRAVDEERDMEIPRRQRVLAALMRAVVGGDDKDGAVEERFGFEAVDELPQRPVGVVESIEHIAVGNGLTVFLKSIIRYQIWVMIAQSQNGQMEGAREIAHLMRQLVENDMVGDAPFPQPGGSVKIAFAVESLISGSSQESFHVVKLDIAAIGESCTITFLAQDVANRAERVAGGVPFHY